MNKRSPEKKKKTLNFRGGVEYGSTILVGKDTKS